MMTRLLLAGFAVFCAVISTVPGPARADGAKTILVLDASGSMWGQIGGEAKITIAQRVINGLLDTLPASQELGLSAYGHRRKGDCSDIELMVPAGPNSRDAIRAAVAGIKPKGKTPLSDAVVAAARALRFEEDAATVILVSDGRETCDVDPCEIGRMLDETGVNFTAHVIGFDVNDPKDRAQLKCLADNTGGRFVPAANADELAEALEDVAAAPAPPPEPEKLDRLFLATDGEDGPVMRSGIAWTLTDLETGAKVLENFDVPDLRISLAPGRYRAEVVRRADDARAVLEVTVATDGPVEHRLALPSSTPDATVEAPASAPVGSTVLVSWTGPDERNDFITVAEPESRGNQQINYAYAKDGSPVKLVMPPTPGTYEVRYILSDGRKILARQAITVTPVEATLSAPDTAVAGATVVVGWTGPDYKNDFITVAEPESRGNQQINYTYTKEGSPLKLVMPPEPGTYELRYVMQQDHTVLARKTIKVTAVEATLSAPDEAAVGSTVIVGWTGPDYKNDFITVAEPESKDNQYVNYTYTKEGSPLRLLMPPEPGSYEIRYLLSQDRKVLARKRIEVVEVAVTLSAPDSAEAGATVAVEWSGPDEKNDFIVVADPDQNGNQYINYTYTKEGSPLGLTMPVDPGTYEIRYVLSQGRRVMARRTIAVTAVAGSLSAPGEAPAGASVTVEWTGPGYQNDFITVARPDDEGNKYINYTYAKEGSPLKLMMPPEAGDYEIRYVLNQDRSVLVRRPIKVLEVAAGLITPESAPAGSDLLVQWFGPAYKNDFIAVARPDQKGNQQLGYTYAKEGSPLRLELPPVPGTYEIRYILHQDRKILARQAIEVTEVMAAIDAPGKGAAGGRLRFDWVGPDYKGDYISIAEVGSAGRSRESYVYTRNGTPAEIALPEKPGNYEIRYVMRAGHTVIARSALIVE